jgi:hypothetical protein
MPVETFHDKTQSIARGMLPALDYRHFQISHGTYRDNDPLPRATSGNKTLPPGERVPLVALEGAGMVKWLKLHGDAKLLANEDLWLEVTVDGESQPALAAPARFLFPGLEAGKNYHNFLVLNKGGFQNVLPMPYASGLAIAAVNRGTKELKGVGVSVSYEPAPADRPVSRLRLRGLFTSGESLSRPGKGRWLGLVCQAPQESASAIVTVDGRPYPGWRGVSWQQVTGLEPGVEQTRCLSGQSASLAWIFHLLAPIDFDRSFELRFSDAEPGGRLALFYAE